MLVRRWIILTLLLAGVAGVVTACWTHGVVKRQRMVDAIVADDAEVRRRAWGWLHGRDEPDGPRRAEQLLETINQKLIKCSNDALLDATGELRAMDLWGWDTQPYAPLIREARLRAGSDNASDVQLAIDLVRAAPANVQASTVVNIVEALVHSPVESKRTVAFDAYCRWLGPNRLHELETLDLPADGIELRRRLWLARLWSTTPNDDEVIASLSTDTPIDVLEAQVLCMTYRHAGDVSHVLEFIDAQPDLFVSAHQSTLAYILRYSDDHRAFERLQRWADAGSTTAEYVLLARQPGREQSRAAQRVGDDNYAIWQQRLAAWRWPRTPAEKAKQLLNEPVADEDGTVYAAALLAERTLGHETAAQLAESWIRSLNDDRKRAGALLAALLGEHRDLLQQAYEVENVGRVRTTQRLALFALGVKVGEGDPIVFAHRAIHKDNGDFNPDTVLCLVLAGQREALDYLLTPPQQPWRLSIQQRAWLIERCVPPWHEALGRPIGGDMRTIDLHFDALRMLGQLTFTSLEFDSNRDVFDVASKVDG